MKKSIKYPQSLADSLWRNICFLILIGIISSLQPGNAQSHSQNENFCGHTVILDSTNRLLPWYKPHEYAYDHFLRLRWDFIKTKVPESPGPAPRSNYPQYYFYCAFKDKEGQLEPDTWMNDIGEKMPNWFESARLYYAYTGDSTVMKIVLDMMDYYLEHGTGPSDFAWPDFPYTTTNAGDTIFRGFTNEGVLKLHEIQVDHAAEMGLTYYRRYLYDGDTVYLNAALNVADVLADYAKKGNGMESVWPYRVVMKTGEVTSSYGANWTGAYLLMDKLVKAGIGNVKDYARARDLTQEFLLEYPMRTGYWTDGHSDTHWDINTYKSNLSASNIKLCLFDFPKLDPDLKTNIPRLIQWTEDYFVFRNAPGEISTMWGAYIVGEQDSFIYKMDYQTARFAAECARWYAVSGDESYKEKAYRSLNWVTYCNSPEGMSYESPLTEWINSWWSDTYGECPRMFYHVFAGIPEWAPPGENHILYSEGILKKVNYAKNYVAYTATNVSGPEFLRLAFEPAKITVSGSVLHKQNKTGIPGYTLRKLENGDYAITLSRAGAGRVVIQ
jgi:hypothetical protein